MSSPPDYKEAVQENSVYMPFTYDQLKGFIINGQTEVVKALINSGKYDLTKVVEEYKGYRWNVKGQKVEEYTFTNVLNYFDLIVLNSDMYGEVFDNLKYDKNRFCKTNILISILIRQLQDYSKFQHDYVPMILVRDYGANPKEEVDLIEVPVLKEFVELTPQAIRQLGWNELPNKIKITEQKINAFKLAAEYLNNGNLLKDLMKAVEPKPKVKKQGRKTKKKGFFIRLFS